MTGKLAEVRADDQKQNAEVDGSSVSSASSVLATLREPAAGADAIQLEEQGLACI